MSSEPVITFEGVGKRYRTGMADPLRALFRDGGEGDKRDFWALRDISFSIDRGDVCGIIGPNGAGKSTILKLLAGVTIADAGRVRIAGRIAPLIELGAGFHPDLSGGENVYLNGALMGMSRAEVRRVYDDIVEFAELGGWMDTPVKRYSSGMFIRLAFSLAVHSDPQILLVDEVLSVGDERFQRKCLKKFLEFRDAGRTIVVVSHDLGLVSTICNNMLFLAHGKVVAAGSVEGAIGRYLQTMAEGDGVGVLSRGECTLLFNSGSGSLFIGGREITTKFGLYTSMLIRGASLTATGIWHDSTRAVWRCATEGASMRCRGEYISAPLAQEWEFSLNDEGVLAWRVWLEVLEPVHTERRQANIMLSDAYQRWSSGDARGEFPPEFTSRDYHNWDILASSGATAMTASAPSLTDVEFLSTSTGFAATVVNSNFFFSGRVLMFLDVEARQLQPGRYPYFSGELRLRTPR